MPEHNRSSLLHSHHRAYFLHFIRINFPVKQSMNNTNVKNMKMEIECQILIAFAKQIWKKQVTRIGSTEYSVIIQESHLNAISYCYWKRKYEHKYVLCILN